MGRPSFVFISPLALTLITLVGAFVGAAVLMATPPDLFGPVAVVGAIPSVAILLLQAGWMFRTYAFLRRLRNADDVGLSPGAIIVGFLAVSAVALAIEFGFTEHARRPDGDGAVMVIPAAFCFLALAVLTAREITIAHQPEPGHIKRPVVDFLAVLYLSPIGIWFLHPRLKRIADRAGL